MNVGASIFLLLACAGALCTGGWTDSKSKDLIGKMESRYAETTDYQAEIEVEAFKGNGSVEKKRALYTFKKPDHIRLDLESPHKGTTLVYPDKNGDVMVKPGGFLGFFTLHLDPDNPLLSIAPGQDITQTDIGLLIRNIAHSLTDQRKGAARASCRKDRLYIQVLAQDHFQKGATTLYTFVIDESLWLPVEVQERTAEGVLKKTFVFKNLKLNVPLPKDFFKGG